MRDIQSLGEQNEGSAGHSDLNTRQPTHRNAMDSKMLHSALLEIGEDISSETGAKRLVGK